ncbi:MAG: ATP-binding cassette domain-containing protein, partial [Chloroflexi bacterium]|nr:ATP-binding cassette domain-containing protein [Chloroflexota bacterium]
MALELRGICKRFGAVMANDDVSLRVEPGELHGLLGENGAGKSTLVRVLSGYLEADAGTIVLDGQPLTLRSPRDALAAGIGILHQDPLVVPSLTVIENFLLGAPGGVRLDRRAGARELARVCAEFGFDLPPDVDVSTLTVGERQQLEIARLLWLGARVLILDEPTTAISDAQRDRLFETVRRLAARGMSLIFVSHKLEEVETICERVTVLRRGRVVGERELPCPFEELVALMFGR